MQGANGSATVCTPHVFRGKGGVFSPAHLLHRASSVCAGKRCPDVLALYTVPAEVKVLVAGCDPGIVHFGHDLPLTRLFSQVTPAISYH